jgi:hypothetical protein
MKIFAALMVFALLVAMLYGIIDIWSTLKKILKELREINGKIGYRERPRKHDWNETPPTAEPPSKADRNLSEVFERLEHDLHGMKNPHRG